MFWDDLSNDDMNVLYDMIIKKYVKNIHIWCIWIYTYDDGSDNNGDDGYDNGDDGYDNGDDGYDDDVCVPVLWHSSDNPYWCHSSVNDNMHDKC